MNIGITISFIVGGILLISILTLNNNVMQHSYQSTVEMTSKSQIDAIRQMIMHDMEYTGFGEDNELLNFSNNHIRFKAKIYGQTRVISWHMPGNPYNDSPNPNDKELRRQGPLDNNPGNDMFTMPVTRFYVQAYSDDKGTNPTGNKNEVRSILIEVEVETPQAVGENPDGTPHYPKTSWKRLFIPDKKIIK